MNLFNWQAQQGILIFRRILGLVDIILHTENAIESNEQRRSLDVPALVIKGECLDHLGDVQDAVACYDRALAIDPEVGDIWALRGLARFGPEPEEATKDFETAISKQTQTISPYLVLSSRALRQRDFLECLRLCLRALTLNPSRAVRAKLLSWIAIAQHHLGYSAQQVRSDFDSARSSNPIDGAIIKNYGIFEHSLENNERPDDLTWEVVLTIQELRDTSYNLVAA
jgi:tetratricopeptide (TPR) repeat protein